MKVWEKNPYDPVFLSPYIFEGTIEESHEEEMKLVEETRRMSL